MTSRSAVVVTLALLAGCTSPRYVGSIGRDRTFVNRGYGFLLRLDHAGLSERFDAITAENLTAFPPRVRSKLAESPVDLDGDGFLDPTETTRHLEPALRLVSRTSTAVTIDITVQIIPKRVTESLDSMLQREQELRVPQGFTPRGGVELAIRTSTVTPGFVAKTYEGPDAIVTVIDQADFRAEEGLTRRQFVRVTTNAPRITDAWREEHDHVLRALILNRRGSFETTQEQW